MKDAFDMMGVVVMVNIDLHICARDLDIFNFNQFALFCFSFKLGNKKNKIEKNRIRNAELKILV